MKLRMLYVVLIGRSEPVLDCSRPSQMPSQASMNLGLTVRRVLLRGTTKALLYVVLEESLEVRVLSCYDTRSDHPNYRP